MEAMEAGCAIASLRVDPDGILGTYRLGFSAGDSWEVFVSGFRGLLDHPETAREYGANGRAYLGRFHHPDAVAAAFITLIETISTK